VQNQRLATFYRVVLLIPAVIPSTLVFVLWKWMYNYQIGPINHVLVNVLGLFTVQNAPQWLGGTSLTLPSIALMEVWWGLGYHAIFFLAGLAAIPKELVEAARLDGANEWHVFWHVTLPRLMPIMMILVVLRFGSAMAVIDEYLIFGGFNRASPTYTWTIYMYDQAFKMGMWRQGFGAAIGMIGAVAMMIVVTLLLRVFRPKG
jgi:ABC-type sugar transport system permease subunit